jgi:hypothetical protein
LITYSLSTLAFFACDHAHEHDDHHGHEEEGLSALAEELCLHLENGPSLELNAAALTEITEAPSLDQAHTRFDITLLPAEEEGRYEGLVTLNSDEAGMLLLGARNAMGELGELNLELSSAEDGELVSAEEADADELEGSCLSDLDKHLSALYPVELGQYQLKITHNQALVQLTLEAVAHDDHHDEHHDEHHD